MNNKAINLILLVENAVRLFNESSGFSNLD